MVIEKRRRSNAWRDLAIVVAATLTFAIVSVRLDLGEAFARWARPLERYQLDELPGILLFLAVGLAWLAWRRASEARVELRRRLAIEAELAAMLTENRRLERANVRLVEDERRRLARELHDELGQNLNAIKLDAVCVRELAGAEPAAARSSAASIIDLVDRVQRTVGDMVRRLRPTGLDELGLAAALEDCVDGWRRRMPETRFELAVPTQPSDWGEPVNIALYRLVQEALTNVARHARARRVAVQLTSEEGGDAPQVQTLVLQITDDGVGAAGAAAGQGLGLVGMRERVESLGGVFDASSPAQGGFRIVARLPVAGALA
ncbi:MAG TPA: histidine kinase [Casimicrobiaceae bacterium]|nr:histidine kinase [Casimicrobiaceae bacterium]